MFGPGSEFYNSEGSAPDKVIVEALVSIKQPYQIPAGVLYSFNAIVQYKSHLLPPLIFAVPNTMSQRCFTDEPFISQMASLDVMLD